MTVIKESTVAEKVLQLTIERGQTKDRKKAVVSGYNEEIKRIEAEIKALIEDKPKEEEEVDA